MEVIKTIFEIGVLILLVILMIKDHYIIKKVAGNMSKVLK